MTDNEIIMALKCCLEFYIKQDSFHYCDKCPLGGEECDYGYCKEIMIEKTIDLINRQKEQINSLINGQETLQKHIAEQKAEIERLEKHNSNMALKHYNNGITDGVEIFAKRLKKKYPWKEDYLYSTKRTVEDIDNLVKEMVGDNE